MEKKSTKIGFSITLVIILLVSIGTLPSSAFVIKEQSVIEYQHSNLVNNQFFTDPLYGYSLTLPLGWYVLPAQPDALFGATVFLNYDPNLVDEENPDLPDDATKIQIGVAPLGTNQTLDDWVVKWVDFEVNNSLAIRQSLSSSSINDINVGRYVGRQFDLISQFGETVTEIDLLTTSGQVMVIGISFYGEKDLVSVLDILSTITPNSNYEFSNEIISIAESWSIKESPKVNSNDSIITPDATCIAGTFPGTEAPNTPILLYMPFAYGETWKVGGAGSFYGNGYHCNSNNDYYATDWNRPDGDDSGRAVLPVADGTISFAVPPTCPTTDYGCYVRIDHASGVRTLYGHLSSVYKVSGSVSHNDQIGAVGTTGTSTGPHLHLSFKQDNGGYHSYCWNSGNTCPNGESPLSPQSPKPSPMQTTSGSQTIIDGSTYTSSNGGGGTSCPSVSGEVRLFDSTDCGGSYVTATGLGLWSMVDAFNDRAESISIPSGWSTRLYKDNSESSPSACIQATDSNLWNNTFSDSTVVANETTWMRVYDNTNCQSALVDAATFISQSTYPLVTPGQSFQVYFEVRNTGTSTWQPGSYWLQNIQNPLGANSQQPLSKSVAPNETYRWTISMTAPNTAGTYRSQWWISHNGTTFGPNMYIDVTVQSGPPPAEHSVQFYKDWHYELGYCFADTAAAYMNLDGCPGYDEAISSVILKTGWSVRVFKNRDLGGTSKCFTSNDDDFANNTFDDGSAINDQMSSFILYNQSTCPPPSPGAFSKTSPANGATGQSTNLTLTWGSSSGATSYESCYDTTNDNACSNWTSSGTSTSRTISGLSNGTTYYWHVRAVNSGGTTYSNSSSTAFWSFTTTVSAPGAFSKISPANGATSQSTNPTLTWGSSSGATSYESCYDTTNDNACSNWTSSAASTSRTLSGLSNGTTYYWHVRAVNLGGTTYSNSSSTAFWSFTTTVSAPGAFSKTSPANGATGQSTNPTLTWGSSSGATSYESCYDTTNDNACSNWTSSGASTSRTLSGLSNGTTYFWQVRAWNGSAGPTMANGDIYWSFTIQSANQPPDMPSNLHVVGSTLNTATIAWDDVVNEIGYHIYRWNGYTAFDFLTSLGANVTSFTDTGLSCGASYWYEVSAYNIYGESSHAGWVQVDMLACPSFQIYLPFVIK